MPRCPAAPGSWITAGAGRGWYHPTLPGKCSLTRGTRARAGRISFYPDVLNYILPGAGAFLPGIRGYEGYYEYSRYLNHSLLLSSFHDRIRLNSR
jgi:hypothetical protein